MIEAAVPELLARLVLATTINVMAAQRAVKAIEGLSGDNGAIEALNAARATLDALAVTVESMLPATNEPDPGEEVKPNTDDPATCGHGSTMKVINQTMCATCGATQQEDGTWAIL